ncbi:hypothetical protein FRC10_010614 [Ceratobasidium sp. 414]|nr:hypothetical protein FRC10_010614 [Ceratobasidium sp. 414]
MLQLPFAAALEPAQSSRIIPLVTHLTDVLASSNVTIDDTHSPRLHSRFLSGLIAKQSWIDNYLLPGFNANFADAAGSPPADMRQWYVMNRGAIFPGVGTDRWTMNLMDVGLGLHGTSPALNSLGSRLDPIQTIASSDMSPSRGMNDISQVIACLSQQGCANITDQLDQTSCSEYPISTGGFGDIYRGRLKNGGQIAIKTLRFRVGCGSDDRKALKVSA